MEAENMRGEATAAGKTARPDFIWLGVVAVVFLIGLALRVVPSAAFTAVGFDENLYRAYVNQVTAVGVFNYPRVVEGYLEYQRTLTYSILPPVRFLYIFSSYLWGGMFGTTALQSLHQVACFFSVLTLPVSFFFARRLAGKWTAVGVLALMSFAPTQIHMSQHALVDGFFAFWALLTLWLLWENLQRPNHKGLLAAYLLGLMLMALTKENTFFVCVGIWVILGANRWLRFGKITPGLLVCTIIGPILGVLTLALLAGGISELVATYQQSVSKNFTLPYAIKTGDGPWYRYFVDLMTVNPVVLVLAIGGIFSLDRTKKALVFVTLFVAGSYLIMCNLKYGMNLRYANMWDMPLSLLAFTQLSTVSESFGERRKLFLVLSVIGICAFELHQYWTFFVEYPLYELVSEGLLRAVKILK